MRSTSKSERRKQKEQREKKRGILSLARACALSQKTLKKQSNEIKLGTWTVYRINSWNNVAAGLSGCNAQTPCFGDYPQVS